MDLSVPRGDIQGGGTSPPQSPMTWAPALAGGGKGEGLRVGLRSEYQKKLSRASDPGGVGGYIFSKFLKICIKFDFWAPLGPLGPPCAEPRNKATRGRPRVDSKFWRRIIFSNGHRRPLWGHWRVRGSSDIQIVNLLLDPPHCPLPPGPEPRS